MYRRAAQKARGKDYGRGAALLEEMTAGEQGC
jgi:hypothetical protein